MEQKVLFLAGASGAIGRRLAPLLVTDGWTVFGTTRSQDKALMLRRLGVQPVVVDVFDKAALAAAVFEATPTVVMHQLTDLPPALDPAQMGAALPRNARLREEGTANLIAAAIAAKARRFIAQSISFIYAEGPLPHKEEDALAVGANGAWGMTARGVASLERQAFEAPLESIVLRYGMLYGPGTGFDTPPGAGSLHVDAAAYAALLATRSTETGLFNITEDDEAATSAKARSHLGFDARFRCPGLEPSPSSSMERL